jgi:isopentenyl-diphosphate delta-isomerase
MMEARRAMATVDSDRVVLLDERGLASGTARKDEIHGTDTPLHLAFSCYLFAGDGRVLITRRSLEKRSWPGVWTNSFCGHPAPGEELADAVRRHARHELGVSIDEPDLVLPDFRYRAVDATGVVENELCPVFVARTDDTPAPLAAEVAEWAWVTPTDLIHTAASMPAVLSPWSVLQIPLIADVLSFTGDVS